MHTCHPNCNGSGEKGDANPVETSVTRGCVVCHTAMKPGSAMHHHVIARIRTRFIYFDSVTVHDIFQFMAQRSPQRQQTRVRLVQCPSDLTYVKGMLANDLWCQMMTYRSQQGYRPKHCDWSTKLKALVNHKSINCYV